MSKLWQKSTTDTQSEPAKRVEFFTVGNDYMLDQVLVPFDVRASKVHAKALKKAGIISNSELDKLTEVLSEIEEVWKAGNFSISLQDEDMHTAIENYLIEKLGDLGKKIHTGRSRNDQVLTAMRLYEKEALEEILVEIKTTALALIDKVENYKNIPMPGFTHTRKAMLSSAGLWAGGFAEMLIMQLNAAAGVKSLIDQSPLGTAAGFGTTFDLDREFEAVELGFAKPIICSTTAQLSRGWVELQLVQYLSNVTFILNRLASDIIQFSSEAYPWFDLDDVVCTGSSIMPQKKNPDVAELIRGGHSEMAGFAATLQSLTVNLGGGYHRDLQLSKEPVIYAFKKAKELLGAVQLLIEHTHPNSKNLKKSCTTEIFAAEAANKLVKEQGISFREAYKKVASDPDLTKSFSVEKMMNEYTQLGSPGNPGMNDLKRAIPF